jgi:hypothetical protein
MYATLREYIGAAMHTPLIGEMQKISIFKNP